MTVKEKLENLLCETGMGKTESAFVADSLIAHGVTIREQGEWVWDKRFGDYYCSHCHDWDMKTPNFCKNCGAPMKKVE